ncbi:MAG TPA: lamin tail domain-containing protein [Polyangiaceae bacterium]
MVVAPLRALASGKVSLATPELGLVAEVVVDAGALPLLARTWPPPDSAFGNGTAVYCGDAAFELPATAFAFAPTGEPGSLAPGLDETGSFLDECAHVEPDAEPSPGTPLLPPPVVAGVLLEPRLLVVAAQSSQEAACAEATLAFGPVCAHVGDDRLTLSAPSEPAFVAIDAPSALLGVVRPGESLVLRGFTPATPARVSGLVIAMSGERTHIDAEVVTLPARPHVVLNEVLANPAGAEAAGEWIELVNDGVEAVDLEGFVLDDAVEPTPLPKGVLAPGELALLVTEAHGPDPELDVPPPPDALLLRVPRLGRGGLANSGELLRLRDPLGNVVSRFPALAGKAPGTSVARRSPEAPDEPAWFGEHAPPGASPGAPNVLEPVSSR